MQILEKFHSSGIKKVVPFNFQTPQITAQLEKTAGRGWQASLEGSAQVCGAMHCHSKGAYIV